MFEKLIEKCMAAGIKPIEGEVVDLEGEVHWLFERVNRIHDYVMDRIVRGFKVPIQLLDQLDDIEYILRKRNNIKYDYISQTKSLIRQYYNDVVEK